MKKHSTLLTSNILIRDMTLKILKKILNINMSNIKHYQNTDSCFKCGDACRSLLANIKSIYANINTSCILICKDASSITAERRYLNLAYIIYNCANYHVSVIFV